MDSPKQVIGLKIVVLLTAVLVAGFSSSKCAAQTRTWTDVSETYKIEAELKDVVESDEGLKAELLMSDGKLMAILISKLCEADAKLAAEFYAESLRKGASDSADGSATIPVPTGSDAVSNDPAKRSAETAHAEESIVSRPLAAPLSMSNGKLDNRNKTDVKFDPSTAIRLEREIPRDKQGRPTENPVYFVKVSDDQLSFLAAHTRALVDKLRDPKTAVDEKRRAIEALRDDWPKGRHVGLLNVLINTLSHEDKFLRLAALDLLANHDSDQSLIYIFARIDDISFDVRWRTYEVLTQLRDPRIIPELCERLRGADRTKVASVLQVFGNTSAPLVNEWVKLDENEDVLLGVSQLLGNIGEASSLEVLGKLKNHKSLLVRSQANNSIKQIKQRLELRASKMPSRR